ncbi:MAG: efflux RND transporter permease subunit, partial [Calditrichaeota bacterium]|nr:efflux RND transporter permease subunit [Calditrichota bacterium]
RMLRKLLRRPGMVIFAVLVLCFVSYYILLPKLGGELIPSVSQGTFNIELTLPVGTALEKTADIVHPIEIELSQLQGVKKVSSRIGGELMSAEQSTRGPNKAVISVLMTPGGDTERREAAIVQQVREYVAVIPSLEMLITHPTLFSFKQPFEIILKGNDLDKLRKQGLEVENRLSKLPMLADVESSVRTGHPEVIIKFDRNKLARLGLNARSAAERVQSAILGNVPTHFRERERRIDIRIRIDEANRESIDELRRLVINPDQKVPVNLSDVATLELVEGPAEITRVDGVRAAIVTADIIESDLKSADGAIRASLAEMNLIEGYDYVISGQRREMDDSLSSLRFAFLLAVFLVYVVMASQFESFRHPLLILLTIPLAVACVMPVLWGFNISLSVMVFLGLIVLAGIVVNNSIVLVDYINQMVESGKPVFEAVVESAAARIRPILMTSLTTILALLPMALGVGEGVEIRRPMAITIIFGLSFATLITLIVIPLLYNVVSRGKRPL